MNKKLTLLVGPPGSGKSTVAKQCFDTYTYINQDSQGREHLHLFDMAILAGGNVVVDRMGFSRAQRNRYLWLAKEHGYETEIVVIHEPYAVCLERCLKRKDHLTIKDETGARSALQTFFTKYERVTDDEADTITRVWPEGYKPLAVICDLDGTLCDISHRKHFVEKVEGKKKDWKGFFANIANDCCFAWCADILTALSTKYKVVYCSGRPDDHRKVTEEWLKRMNLYNLCEGHLYMRPRGDHREDSIAKEIILDFEILTRFTPYFFIDDRQRVVDVWRHRGFVCLHCAKGDF